MREIADSGASAAAPMRHAALREGAWGGVLILRGWWAVWGGFATV